MIIEIVLTNMLAWIIALGIFAMQRAHDMQERDRMEMLLDWKKLFDICTTTLDSYASSFDRGRIPQAERLLWNRTVQSAIAEAHFVHLRSSDQETRQMAADIVEVLLTMSVNYVLTTNQGVVQRGGGEKEYNALQALEDRILDRLPKKFERNERLLV